MQLDLFKPDRFPFVMPSPGQLTNSIVRSWLEIKQKYPDCIVFVRWQEFYFTFLADAQNIALLLNEVPFLHNLHERTDILTYSLFLFPL